MLVEVDDANDTEEEVLVMTTKDDDEDVDSWVLVLDAASLVTRDSLEDAWDDDTVDGVLLVEDSLSELEVEREEDEDVKIAMDEDGVSAVVVLDTEEDAMDVDVVAELRDAASMCYNKPVSRHSSSFLPV